MAGQMANVVGLKERLTAALEGRAIADLLSDAGFRIEGPGKPEVDSVGEAFWWTLGRPGWSGYETSDGHFSTAQEAEADALESLFNDYQIDWAAGAVHETASGQFSEWFLSVLKRSTVESCAVAG